MAFLLCTDFIMFPDNFPLPPAFTLSSMDFNTNPGGPHSFVNLVAGTLAMQFPDVGLEVDLPPLAFPRIRLRVGAFAGPFDIRALDVSGQVVAQRTVTVLNLFHNIGFRQPGIERLVFSGGNNEGLIASICVVV